MTQTIKTIIPLAIVFALLVATNFIYAAWSAPAGAPSAANNTPAPINVGTSDQVKSAALGVDGLAVFGDAIINGVMTASSSVRSPQYCDENGLNCLNMGSSTPSGGDGLVFAGGYIANYNLKYSSNVTSVAAQGVDWKVTLASAPTGDTRYVVIAGGSSYGNVWSSIISPTEFYISGASSGGNRGLIPNVSFAVYAFSNSDSLTPTSWVAGAWGACISYTQTRTVTCVDDTTGNTVADALCTGVKPATTQSCGTPPPASCFVAGTQVAMADGSYKNIEDVTIGESVKGKDGTINTVQAYDRPMLDGRLLYSFNGGPFSVTAEHPFFTNSGWKSISAQALVEENPSLAQELSVTSLQIGDRIQQDDGSWITIHSIESKVAEDQRLYNFRLDGNSTYYSDGFLTHNK